MNVDGIPHRSIWPGADGWTVQVIDQSRPLHDSVVADPAALANATMVLPETQARDRLRGIPVCGRCAETVTFAQRRDATCLAGQVRIAPDAARPGQVTSQGVAR